VTNSATYLSQFHQLLNQHFDLAEIRMLCLDLNIDYESVAGEEKPSRIRELLLGLGRNGRLPELITLLQQERPKVDWPPLPDGFELPESLVGETAVPANQYHVYGDVVHGDKIGRDKNVVGDISGQSVVAIGAGAAVYQGLAVEEVALLVAELKRVDQPKVWNGSTPYLGLSAFQESDAQFFFGRESLVTELLERVKIARFIVIAGPSGSGKSSVARAGLFHALREGRLDKSNNWLLATMQPKGNPFLELATAIDRMVGKPNAGDYLRENGRSNPLALHEQIEPLLSDDTRQRCVILVDQFEETFTQTKAEDRAPFIALLTEAARMGNGRVTIILSFRADFVSHCASYPDLRALMSQQFQLVGAMDPPDLAKAITLPALEVGAEIDPALVSRIMADMKGEPGALPLMSFALRDLFEAKKLAQGQPMDLMLPAYLERGGIESALERHANKVFDQFSDQEKALARGVFSKLIEVGQGRADTRRTAAFSELVPAGTEQEEVEAIVFALAKEDVRLIAIDVATNGEEMDHETITHTTVTIAHEKLIDAWPWLRQLVDENREMISLQNQINDDAAAWANEKDISFLYRGGRLIQAEEQLAASTLELNELSHAFIQTSLAERQRDIDEKEVREQQKLEDERALAEAQRQRAEEAEQATAKQSRLTRIAFAVGGVALILFIVAGIAGIWATNSAEEARANEALAETRQSEAITSANIAATRETEANESAILAATSEANAVTSAELAATREAEANESAALAATSEAEAIANADLAATREAEAQRQARLALAQSLAALSPSVYQRTADSELAALLAIEAHNMNREERGSIDWLVDGGLRPLIAQAPPYFSNILEGHESGVWSVAFSPDGQTLASGGFDNTVHLWDLGDPTAAPVVLRGHEAGVLSLAFSSDGQTLASGSEDNTIRLWDVGEPTAAPVVLRGHEADVRLVAFSPDGQTLASGSDDRTIRLWDVGEPTAAPVVLRGHEARVLSVSFSLDGQTLASGSDDRTIRLWDVGEPTAVPIVLSGHGNAVWSVAFSPDGQTLASGSADGTIRFWDVGEPTAVPIVLSGHEDAVWSVAFSPDGQILASGSADRTIRLWDVGEPTAVPIVLSGHERHVVSVAFSPDGQILASGSWHTIRLWDLGKPTAAPVVLSGHRRSVRSVAFSPDGQTLASGSDDNTIWLWDVGDLTAAPIVLSGHEDSVLSVAFSPDGQSLASGSSDRTIRLWNVGDPTAAPVILSGHESSVLSVAFSPDGQTLASGSGDNTIQLWDLGRPTATPVVFNGHEDAVWSVAFSPDGKSLASGSSDKTIRLWDVGEPTAAPVILSGHESSVYSMVFSPDGQTLASGGDDRTIRLWDVEEPTTAPIVLSGHEGAVWSVAFSPDGQTLASGSADRTIRLWDVGESTTAHVILSGHEDLLRTVAFSPDGQSFASGSNDNTIRLWPMLDKLVEIGCLKVRGNLSWQEWQQYLPGEPYRQTCPNLPPHPSVP
jgi:WD40 repeat protein